MNVKTKVNRVAAVLSLVVATASTVVTTSPSVAQARGFDAGSARLPAPTCAGRALADRYDQKPLAFGNGGVTSCPTGVRPLVTVVLYMDGNSVASTPSNDCRTVPCAFSTGTVSIPAGSHSFCADAVLTYATLPGSPSDRVKGNCFAVN